MDDHVSTIARILTITSSIRPRVTISVGTCIEAFEVIMDAMTEMIEASPKRTKPNPARKHHHLRHITRLTREGDHYDSHSTNLRWLRPRCRAG
jgi:hypothetical protein